MIRDIFITPSYLRKPVKRQFGGLSMEYFKNLLPKVQGFMGQTNGQSNLYSTEAQNYYNDLLNRSSTSANSINDINSNILIQGDFGEGYGSLEDNSLAADAYTGHVWDTYYAGDNTWRNAPQWADLSARQQKKLLKRNKYVSGSALDGKNFKVSKLNDGLDQQLFEEDQKYKANLKSEKDNAMGIGLETGANIFALMEGQQNYDKKLKPDLNPSHYRNPGIKYRRHGGPILGRIAKYLPSRQLGGNIMKNLVNTTGYTMGTSTYNNPFNIIPGGNITMRNTDVPILANPSAGKPVVMQPGMDYNFPGAAYVIEQKLPKRKFGGRSIRERLQELNKKKRGY